MKWNLPAPLLANEMELPAPLLADEMELPAPLLADGMELSAVQVLLCVRKRGPPSISRFDGS